MVFKKHNIKDLDDDDRVINPTYARHGLKNPIPKYEMPFGMKNKSVK